MMYHDFGYFYPYPKQLFALEEVKTPLNLQHFLASTQKGHGIKKIAALGKYLRMQGLVNILKKAVTLHLVPSTFMEPVVHESYQIPPKKVTTFSHFMQK
jgi:hypothetical protein